MLVFDTSAYINGQQDHLPPDTFPSVWELIAEAIDDGRIIVPREVYRELIDQGDFIADFIKQHKAAVIEPSEQVQRDAGTYRDQFPKSHLRNRADPFILAEANHRGYAVVTYEGRTFRGVPTTKWHRTMPGICQHFHISCCTLPEALTRLGARF